MLNSTLCKLLFVFFTFNFIMVEAQTNVVNDSIKLKYKFIKTEQNKLEGDSYITVSIFSKTKSIRTT
jgi:hypothetical protein